MKLHLGLMLAAVIAVGCADAETKTDPRVFLLKGTPGVDFQVEPDRLIFPVGGYEDLLGRQPDDILVASSGTGLFRAVVSVSSADGSITVLTRPAELGEAVIDGTASQAADTNDMDGRWSMDGKFDGVLPFDGSLEIGDTTILGNGDLDASITDAHIHFKPNFHLDLDVHSRRVTYFEAIAEGSLEARLTARVQTMGNVAVRQDKELWKSSPKIFTQWIGPVPVIEVVQLSFGVGVEVGAEGAATFEGGGSLTTTLRAGAVYDYYTTGWRGVGEKQVTVVPLGKLTEGDATIDVSVYVYGELDIKFYDVAGPFLYVAPYVGVSHTVGEPGWEPAIGIFGAWGGKVEIFGHSLAGFEKELFDWSHPL
ncbi:MAG TPA: hypothetical protein VGQ83_04875 [Polyangia bacterium]|jgi:hypothetical protein